jgi:hypothetical protein
LRLHKVNNIVAHGSISSAGELGRLGGVEALAAMEMRRADNGGGRRHAL